MRNLVSLRLGEGSLESGFSHILVKIYTGEKLIEEIDIGSLPPNQEIAKTYQKWQWLYEEFITNRGSILEENVDIQSLNWQPRALEFAENSVERGNQESATELTAYLIENINKWLSSLEFQPIDQALRTHLNTKDEVILVIQTNNEILRKLPWHEWSFFKKYTKAEVALSAPKFSFKPQQNSLNAGKVRILAIIGDCTNIDPEADLNTLRNNREVELEIISQPSRQQICHRLREKPGWNILFYAGHSKSNAEKGWISINAKTKLEISELNSALEVAIDNGLQLAIFNSCQGLGLVPQLEELGIPQIIVMREQVQNQVAQEFLAEFIASFSSGKSFYVAIREARSRLKDIEDQYYCASWLPVVCQHWSVIPPTWSELRDPPLVCPPNRYLRQGSVILSGLLVAMLVIGMRSFGFLQTWEFTAFDWLLKMRPHEGVDSRLLIVEATEADINRWGYPLSDGKLAATIESIQQYQPSVIGLLIFRDRSIEPGHQKLLKLLQNDLNLIVLCSVKLADNDPNKPGIASPPGITENRLGFSNIELDEFDGILRRQLLFMNPDLNNPCPTRFSFSFQLASKYLNAKGIKPEVIDSDRIKIGQTTINRLQSNSGAYKNLDNRGFQILINYRKPENIAPTVSLNDVLENNLNPELVKGRMIIIGVVAAISNPTDYFSTPYSQGVLPQISGVKIQAQMTSQIISAVLDKRPLLWTWPETGENFWIIIWSLAGSGITIAWLKHHNYFLLYIYIGISIFILCLICFIFLLSGGWIPLAPSVIALLVSSLTGYLLLKYWSLIPIKIRKS
ncbi:CHASE2 domain-containing protein [Anabaena sp. CCY 0017]|uniref:CHASE2 domain-containing protein n=1 Tax=Anabaena sp. CCY 0017 TaxID=3103866 RepID=UPI0039C617B5